MSQPSLLPQEPQTSPIQVSPPKATPTKPVLKALPTVRDHTTDQLTPEGDEYIPREFDEAGERKVSPQGHALEGREFKMRTFYVPNRGEKKFMLATECARVLNYRDSYLLFNKNRSLYKIIATQAEKDELIHQEILPYSYRSRQIAIVTAKSMFRQFGARVVVEGRRVKDDYWEAKARKQGFTEEDLAGEKRPGGTKAREAMEAAHVSPDGLAGPNVVYNMIPMSTPQPQSAPVPLPMIQAEGRGLDFSDVHRPRQEMTGPPYQDHTQRSAPTDLMHQAHNAAENSKSINQQRSSRQKIYEDSWNKPHPIQIPTPNPDLKSSPHVSQSPHLSSNAMASTPQGFLNHQGSNMMSPQNFPRHGSAGPSPMRQPMPTMPSNLQQHSAQNRSAYNPNQHAPQTSPYGYHPQPGQMWGHPPPQPQSHPQQSPISPHHQSLPHYSPSPHPSQTPLQHHPSQSPHAQQPPQLQHAQSSGSMHSNMTYQTMAGMPRGGPAAAYGGMGANRSMYNPGQQQPGGHAGSPTPQQQHDFMGQITAAQQGAGWAAPSAGQPGAQGWTGYPVSSGY